MTIMGTGLNIMTQEASPYLYPYYIVLTLLALWCTSPQRYKKLFFKKSLKFPKVYF